MAAVSRCIQDNLSSDVALINQLGAYIIQAGGKRLRPVALLLAARACSNDTTPPADAITLAAVVEFIHTATLLHDDVVDESSLRRGRETANEVFGNAASVLVGDYLYSRAFEMMVTTHNHEVMALLSTTTNHIAEGEVMQLLNIGAAETTEQQYLDTIQSKTAILFAAATRLGAIATNADEQAQSQLYDYGLHLGTAFQLIDDALDYSADAKALGKNVGDDLAEGKPTLPLIHALSVGNDAQKERLTQAITQGSRNHFDEILTILQDCGSLQYTLDSAAQQTQRAITALDQLKDSDAKQALIGLAEFSLTRTT